jgi:heme-degrading monooxygenase HmoA
MHATIRSYGGNAELADRLAARQGDVRALIEGIDGFQAYYLLRSDDGTVSISVFEDAAGAEESNRVAAAWLAENMPDVSVSPPSVTAGEVVIGAARTLVTH